MSQPTNTPQYHLPLLDEHLPPATRAECADIPRPCNRYACRHHLWPTHERAGRKHGSVPGELFHGTPSNATTNGVSDAIAEGRVDSCALDLTESGEQRSHEQIAALLPRPKKNKRQGKPKSDTPSPLLTKERIRQIAERGLNKQWGALTFVKCLDDFIAEFGDAGGQVEFLWGVIVDDEGNHLAKKNDSSRVWVTLGLNCDQVQRPYREEVNEKRVADGVVKRKKAAA